MTSSKKIIVGIFCFKNSNNLCGNSWVNHLRIDVTTILWSADYGKIKSILLIYNLEENCPPSLLMFRFKNVAALSFAFSFFNLKISLKEFLNSLLSFTPIRSPINLYTCPNLAPWWLKGWMGLDLNLLEHQFSRKYFATYFEDVKDNDYHSSCCYFFPVCSII